MPPFGAVTSLMKEANAPTGGICGARSWRRQGRQRLLRDVVTVVAEKMVVLVGAT